MLFIGDDWSEAHHDIEVVDDSGRVLARRRLPEGLAGITTLHELAAEHLDPTAEPDQVQLGIETERGPWVQALLAAGYEPDPDPSCAAGRHPGPGLCRHRQSCPSRWCSAGFAARRWWRRLVGRRASASESGGSVRFCLRVLRTLLGASGAS